MLGGRDGPLGRPFRWGESPREPSFPFCHLSPCRGRVQNRGMTGRKKKTFSHEDIHALRGRLKRKPGDKPLLWSFYFGKRENRGIYYP